MIAKIGFFFLLLLSVQLINAQEEINQLDKDGGRHGYWKKTYPGSEQVRYEGTFEHGKEVGVFKFYCEDCGSQPMAVRTFSEKDDSVWVQYYTSKGKLVSEGKLLDREREGEWVYYHEKSERIMTKEFYKAGKLHGKKSTYYPDGAITEELNYEYGQRQGENLFYSPEGVIIKRLNYKDDELQGAATYYDAAGQVVIEGNYKEGKKYGLWKYFKNGELEFEETYPKPRKKRN